MHQSSTQNFLLTNKNLAIGVTHTFSPRTINEFRFGYNKDRGDSIPDWDGGNITQELGIKNLNPVPHNTGFRLFQARTLPGLGPFGWDIVSSGTVYQYSDVLTLIRGAHTVKLGVRSVTCALGQWQKIPAGGEPIPLRASSPDNSRAEQLFQRLGDSSLDFLLGIPQRAQGSTGSTFTEFDWTHLPSVCSG